MPPILYIPLAVLLWIAGAIALGWMVETFKKKGVKL